MPLRQNTTKQRFMKTINAVYVNILDNCVTLTDNASAGDTVSYLCGGVERSVATSACIPIWHKMAIESVEEGGSIYKYGAEIGVALERIGPGEHIHIHNMGSRR